LTAHVVRAWWEWRSDLGPRLQRRLDLALRRALTYLAQAQRADGAWIPLWIGHQSAPRHENPTYGTAQVVQSLNPLAAAGYPETAPLLARGRHWLGAAQNADGSWGGDVAVAGSVEETSLALSALAGGGREPPLDRALAWLVARMRAPAGLRPAPIGLYFASLWYAEELYPWIFLAGALGELATAKGLHSSPAELTSMPTLVGS